MVEQSLSKKCCFEREAVHSRQKMLQTRFSKLVLCNLPMSSERNASRDGDDFVRLVYTIKVYASGDTIKAIRCSYHLAGFLSYRGVFSIPLSFCVHASIEASICTSSASAVYSFY
jgi:hypothetical protein